MNEFTFPPKYKVGDLVQFARTKALLVVVKVEPSSINKLPLFVVHMPNGNQGLAFQSELEYANGK